MDTTTVHGRMMEHLHKAIGAIDQRRNEIHYLVQVHLDDFDNIDGDTSSETESGE